MFLRIADDDCHPAIGGDDLPLGHRLGRIVCSLRVDLRAQAHLILQQILGRPVAFDPYAPEALRRQQIAGLREQVSRKAG